MQPGFLLCTDSGLVIRLLTARGQELSHLTLIVGPGLTNENVGRFADSKRTVFGKYKTSARISRKELPARGFGLKNKTGIVIVIIFHAGEGGITEILDSTVVLATGV